MTLTATTDLLRAGQAYLARARARKARPAGEWERPPMPPPGEHDEHWPLPSPDLTRCAWCGVPIAAADLKGCRVVVRVDADTGRPLSGDLLCPDC